MSVKERQRKESNRLDALSAWSDLTKGALLLKRLSLMHHTYKHFSRLGVACTTNANKVMTQKTVPAECVGGYGVHTTGYIYLR